MGKNKVAKKISSARLREFRRQRRIMSRIVTGLFILFIASVAAVGVFLPDATWMPVVAVGLYILGFILLRQYSKCPYCDEPIMVRFNKQTHCPHCHHPIDPDLGSK